MDSCIAGACLLLTGGSASVRDIARRVGFANLSNFNRQFRRHTGTTPRRYRQSTADTDKSSQGSGGDTDGLDGL